MRHREKDGFKTSATVSLFMKRSTAALPVYLLNKTGKVCRQFRAIFCLLLLSCLGSSISAQDLYTGVWRGGTDKCDLQTGLTWSAFTAKWSELANQNLRLVDVSTYTSGNTRYYNGVWRAGTDGYALWDGLTWDQFVAKWTAYGQQNLRLIDIETYMSGSTRLYLGIWRAGTDGYALYAGLNWNDFTAKWSELANQNLRLIDVASYLENGTRLYTGVWRAGTDGYYLSNGLEWGAFTAQWQQLSSQNLRLINISSYIQDNKRLYLGVYRAGTDACSLWDGTDKESTTSKWAELKNNKQRLINLETYETTCDATCLNHALMNNGNTYNYVINSTTYSWPNLKIDNKYYLRNSAVFGAKDQIFTLPFIAAPETMGHNGWMYNPINWHHAIDYYRTDTTKSKTFKIVAAAAGKVIYIGWDTWSGNTMVISHDVGNQKDVYRTIYMHLQNGPQNDCGKAWDKTVPTLSGDQKRYYTDYLNSTGCPEKGPRNPAVPQWGLESQKIDMSLLNKTVTAGQQIAWAGSTGPGGCNCANDPGRTTIVNTHLHIFFAHKDPTDNHWYFFDPYGIYSYAYPANISCYPTGVNEPINGQCARYPVAWKNGRPNYASKSLAKEADEAPPVAESKAILNTISVSPNPSTGSIAVKYNSAVSGKVNITIYDKTGLTILKRADYAVKGDNIYRFNLSNVLAGIYFVEISDNLSKARNKFIISK